MQSPASPKDPHPPPRAAAASMRFGEFVALIAAMMATQAIAIDGMLPALPAIARALGVGVENHSQWVITSYVVGLASGQLCWGFISDRFGRRPVLVTGLILSALAAMLCGLSQSFPELLAWRFLHGLAAASAVVARSVVRDLYSGRHMARVMSLTFIVFLMVPIVAPSIGQLVMLLGPWRHIFMVFAGFGALVGLWALLRLPETLHPEFRLSLSWRHIVAAARLVLTTRTSVCYTLAQTILFGSLLSYVGMVQQIFAEVFHQTRLMPSLFALCAVAMGCASYLNSRIVERLGMRVISHAALLLFLAFGLLHVLVALLHAEPLWAFVALQSATLASFGLAVANFGAMAMEPLGAIAGIGASLQGSMSQFLAALIGALIGRQFNGSTVPLALGVVVCGLCSLLFVLLAERGRLFHAHRRDASGADASTPAIDLGSLH